MAVSRMYPALVSPVSRLTALPPTTRMASQAQGPEIGLNYASNLNLPSADKDIRIWEGLSKRVGRGCEDVYL